MMSVGYGDILGELSSLFVALLRTLVAPDHQQRCIVTEVTGEPISVCVAVDGYIRVRAQFVEAASPLVLRPPS